MSDEHSEPVPSTARPKAEVLSSIANDTLWTQNITLHHEGLSAVRVFGEKYLEAGRERSEDSLHAEMNYNCGTAVSRDDGERIMRSVVKHMRDKVKPIKGGATFAAVMTTDDGIAFSNIGDSHIFLAGDKGAFQLNTPQEGMAVKDTLSDALSKLLGKPAASKGKDKPAGGLTNFVGKYLSGSGDEFVFLSYTASEDAGLWERVGNNARIIVASDGVLERHRQPNIAAVSNEDYQEKIRLYNDVEFGKMGKDRDARTLADKARTLGSRDDISIISFDAKPADGRHIAAFLSDGAGGIGDKKKPKGAVVSRVAIAAAADALHSEMKKRGVEPEYHNVEAEGFDPKPVAVMRVVDTREENRRNGLLSEIVNKATDAVTMDAGGIAHVDTAKILNRVLAGRLAALGYKETDEHVALNEKDSKYMQLQFEIQVEALKELARSYPDAVKIENGCATVDMRKLAGAHDDLTGDLGDIGVERAGKLMLGVTHTKILGEALKQQDKEEGRARPKTPER